MFVQVIGYFESEDSDEFRNFQVSGDELVESCQFYAAVGDIAKPEMKQGANVLFKNKIKNRVDRPFYGNLADRDQFKKVWTQWPWTLTPKFYSVGRWTMCSIGSWNNIQ